MGTAVLPSSFKFSFRIHTSGTAPKNTHFKSVICTSESPSRSDYLPDTTNKLRSMECGFVISEALEHMLDANMGSHLQVHTWAQWSIQAQTVR